MLAVKATEEAAAAAARGRLTSSSPVTTQLFSSYKKKHWPQSKQQSNRSSRGRMQRSRSLPEVSEVDDDEGEEDEDDEDDFAESGGDFYGSSKIIINGHDPCLEDLLLLRDSVNQDSGVGGTMDGMEDSSCANDHSTVDGEQVYHVYHDLSQVQESELLL
jgi:hypothetical protein